MSEWKPISELPPDGDDILVMSSCSDHVSVGCCFNINNLFYRACKKSGRVLDPSITHWAEMPKKQSR